GAAKGLADVGFDRRKKIGLGHFLTRDQIEEKIPTYMTDIFTTMPGIHVDYSSGQPVLTGSRGTTGSGCVNYVVDGTPYSRRRRATSTTSCIRTKSKRSRCTATWIRPRSTRSPASRVRPLSSGPRRGRAI